MKKLLGGFFSLAAIIMSLLTILYLIDTSDFTTNEVNEITNNTVYVH